MHEIDANWEKALRSPVGHAVFTRDRRIAIGKTMFTFAIVLFCYWLFLTTCWMSGTFKMPTWGIVLIYWSLPFIAFIIAIAGLLFNPVNADGQTNPNGDNNLSISHKRPLIYIFEHITLPKSALTNDHKLMDFLEHPTNHLPMLMLLGHAESFGESCGAIEPEPDYEYDENGESELENAKADELMAYAEAINVFPFQKDGFTVYVLTMPMPLHVPECHLVAILRKDGESTKFGEDAPSTRFFTLEKSSQSDSLCFIGEWKLDDRLNHGTFNGTDKQNFADRVFELNNNTLN